jgi:hypothetical protein
MEPRKNAWDEFCEGIGGTLTVLGYLFVGGIALFWLYAWLFVPANG